jgi:hypothetical protein
MKHWRSAIEKEGSITSSDAGLSSSNMPSPKV